MTLTIAIIVLVVLALGLIALLSGMMSLPRHMERHRARGGKPAARVRRFSRQRRAD